jgi:hypothetical protein
MTLSKALVATILLASCGVLATNTLNAPAPGAPVYHGVVDIDPANATLKADWRIAFVPDMSNTRDVVLLLNRGLRVTTLSGAGVESFAQKDTAGDNRVTVTLKPTLGAGSATEIRMSYAGTPVFGEDGINRIKPEWIELGLDATWHPVFATYDQRITGSVDVRSPIGWDLVASGNIEQGSAGARFTNTLPLIDLAFVAAPAINASGSGVATLFHVNADSTTIRRVLDTTTACASYLNEQYGAREKLPHIKLVMAPRAGPGYARTNYIVITDVAKLPADALSRFLCHELAHFWSIGAVSSGPENWLNEAFAEYVSLRYVRAQYGDSAYNQIITQLRTVSEKQPRVWARDATTRPGGVVAYRKAPYLLHRLEERIGRATMDRILARRMIDRVTTTSALLQIIAEVAGADAATWFEAELGK